MARTSASIRPFRTCTSPGECSRRYICMANCVGVSVMCSRFFRSIVPWQKLLGRRHRRTAASCPWDVTRHLISRSRSAFCQLSGLFLLTKSTLADTGWWYLWPVAVACFSLRFQLSTIGIESLFSNKPAAKRDSHWIPGNEMPLSKPSQQKCSRIRKCKSRRYLEPAACQLSRGPLATGATAVPPATVARPGLDHSSRLGLISCTRFLASNELATHRTIKTDGIATQIALCCEE